MSFFSKLFGSGSSLDAIRKSAQQGRSADVLARAVDLDTSRLSSSEQEELRLLKETAAERLAQLNLDEGLACLNAGEVQRGIEHLELVLQLAPTADLRHAAKSALSQVGVSPQENPVSIASSCSSSCCDQGTEVPVSENPHGFDEETRLELVLTAYPVDERQRYRALPGNVRHAVLLAHEGDSAEALALLQQVPEKDRDDLYYYETGVLLARSDRLQEGVAALRRALQRNPQHAMAKETLIDLLLANRALDAAEELLQPMLAAKIEEQYCNARLAFLWQARGDEQRAFAFANEALRLGYREPQMLVFVAGVLEREGQVDQAENVLQMIPTSGGCSGGANVELAEFWLRHNKKLQQALEMFKKAAKGDAGNPLWGLCIARTYLALGWKRDANNILKTLANSDMVGQEIRNQASQLLQTTN